MRRVVVTGIGVVSCLGLNQDEVTKSLKEGRSGIRRIDEFVEKGFRSQIAGKVEVDFSERIDRKIRRFMGESAALAYLAMEEAIADSGLEQKEISNERTGLVIGSGGGSPSNQWEAANIFLEKGLRRVGPYRVTQTMGSTTAACLATPFGIKGINYSISSACATSAHCIGHGYEQIQFGKQDIVFAGGAEEMHWILTMMFDAMGALSTKYNETPERASRPYDRDRDGFVIANGGAVVVLEEYEHAKARGAKIYAEVTGFGSTSDGYDMVAPSGEGAVRCMKQAIATARQPIDYINAHGTSTPVGDVTELKAIREVFGERIPYISSTKSLAGHSLGATGAMEAIFSLLMMKHGFIAASANIENLDPEAEGMPVVMQRIDDVELNAVLSNSFGFGGTNACLVFEGCDA
ncbi:MAG: beta-ketoacyl-ACP synthase I [Gammaproteobacteria bacterium]|nr:MAG: beta-ketoacyl-ACP synthase I [Gammaproteobacteria bacterium]